jgi:hypothetical protein
MEAAANVLIPAINSARKLFIKYHDRGMDFKKFRCDLFFLQLINDNKIALDSFLFRNKKFCGILSIDEFETTITFNKSLHPVRRNFTIAHELGHYFLHSYKQKEFVDKESNLLNSVEAIQEKQANAFAAELVLPILVLQVLLRSQFSFNRISSVTKTSHECLKWRIVNHLTEVYGQPQKTSIEAVTQFETESIYGDSGRDQLYRILSGPTRTKN